MGKRSSIRNFFPFSEGLQRVWIAANVAAAPQDLQSHILVGQRKTNLSVAASMSAECERVFSSTKKVITPEKNCPVEEIIEASECLKNWWDRELI